MVIFAQEIIGFNLSNERVKMIRFNEKEFKVLIPKSVIKSITGAVKICRMFLNFSDHFNNFNGF